VLLRKEILMPACRRCSASGLCSSFSGDVVRSRAGAGRGHRGHAVAAVGYDDNITIKNTMHNVTSKGASDPQSGASWGNADTVDPMTTQFASRWTSGPCSALLGRHRPVPLLARACPCLPGVRRTRGIRACGVELGEGDWAGRSRWGGDTLPSARLTGRRPLPVVPDAARAAPRLAAVLYMLAFGTPCFEFRVEQIAGSCGSTTAGSGSRRSNGQLTSPVASPE
jgi:hypothetical protein